MPVTLPATLPFTLDAPVVGAGISVQITRPPFGLSVNVTDASGATTRWSADDPDYRNRPRDLAFGSERGTGFATGGCNLARRGDRDHVDLHLLDNMEVVGDDGSTAWEGRVSALPRSMQQQHTIGVQATGYMSHGRDVKCIEVFCDRDTGAWGDMPNERKATHFASGFSLGDLSFSAGQGGLVAALPNSALGAQTLTEAWYQASPGVRIAKVGYRAKTTSFPAGWVQRFVSATDRAAATGVVTAATLDDTLRLATVTAGRYVLHQIYSNGAAVTPAAGANLTFSKLAAYGDHGLALHTGDPTEPDGLYVSDMLRYLIAKYCPMLSSAGVKDTTYVVPHAAFKDPIHPYDAFLDLNKYHLWDLACWENRTVHYGPTDLTDYDWAIRIGEDGAYTDLQGDEINDLASGMVVYYTDVLTGSPERATPTDYADLRDSSVENPYNQHGYPRWEEITISVPVKTDTALDIGRAALAEHNRPKATGTITTGPWVRDRAGHLQAAWKVRAGQRVAITSSLSLSDRPRPIHSVGYTHGPNGAGAASITVDSTAKTLSAFLDRWQTAISAAGLG